MSRRECLPATIIVMSSIISSTWAEITAVECPSVYTGGDVALAVFITAVVISIILAAAFYAWRLYVSNLEGQHLVLLSPDPEKGESVFAFDNPGFKEGVTAVNSSEKLNNQPKLKWPQWNIIPQGSLTKTKTMDDSFIGNSAPLLTVVPLRSHDFTGLGFNICGNMRDGIFVKDVLHRGPASESGMIAAGDRLEAIKINLRHVVLEDALTILSYASPYEVELTLEPRKKEGASPPIHPPPPPHILSHPQFCKSHSISELHKLNKYYEPRRAESSFSNRKDMNSSFERGSKNSTPDQMKSPFEAKHAKQGSFDEIVSSSNLEHLVKPTQVLEPERRQNSRGGYVEYNSFQQKENLGFIDINLGIDEVDKSSSPKESKPSQTNVKSVLVKGIKNLKEKLHNSLLLDDSVDSKGNSRTSTLEKRTPSKSPTLKKEDGFQTVELHVPEEVERAAVAVREKRRSVINPEELIVNDPAPEMSDSEDPVAMKRNKRKAPRPPPDSDVEELPDCQQDLATSLQFSASRESLKSEDSTASGHNSGMTIELNSSHITVHQAPESESRKASSLERIYAGDLSKYESENVAVLERAVSLDLGDGGAPGTKKRKAPLPPQEDGISPHKEAKVEKPTTGTLKKSSVWGTLEDMIQNGGGSEESEPDLGISGCSTPENSPDKEDEMITSTPFKFGSSLTSENGISNIEVNNSEWDKTDFLTAINGSDTPPELPTSPMPPMSSFITEIQVSCLKRPDSTQVVHLDSTEGLLDHMASSMKINSIEETITLSPVLRSRVDETLSVVTTNPTAPAKTPSPVERQRVKSVSPSSRNNVSVTSIKGQSRIPVRAGPRSPSSTLSPTSKRSSSNQRNGHVSP